MLHAIVSREPVLDELTEALRVRGREKSTLWLSKGILAQGPLTDTASSARIGIASAIKDRMPSALAIAGDVGIGLTGNFAGYGATDTPAETLAGRISHACVQGRSCREAFLYALGTLTGNFVALAIFERLPRFLFVACKGAFVRLAIGRRDVVAYTEGARGAAVAGRDHLLFMEEGDTAICSARGASVLTASGSLKSNAGIIHLVDVGLGDFGNVHRKG